MKYLFLLMFLLCGLLSYPHKDLLRIAPDQKVNDYAEVLTGEERKQLEQKAAEIQSTYSCEIVVVIAKGIIDREQNERAASLAQRWGLPANSLLIIADVENNSYGYYTGPGLSPKFPAWVLEKIESSQLRPNFREKKYFAGINQSLDQVAGIISGKITPDDLKKESSGYAVIILILVLIAFVIVFPVLQLRALRSSHYASKPMDFISQVMLMNTFSSSAGGFESFSKGNGKFASQSKAASLSKGGGGVAGSW